MQYLDQFSQDTEDFASSVKSFYAAIDKDHPDQKIMSYEDKSSIMPLDFAVEYGKNLPILLCWIYDSAVRNLDRPRRNNEYVANHLIMSFAEDYYDAYEQCSVNDKFYFTRTI